MSLTRHPPFRTLALALSVAFVAAASADQKTYFRDNAPTAAQSPAADVYDQNTNPSGWRDVTNGNTGPHTVAAGASIYFGFMNNENPDEKKTVVLKLNWISGNTGSFGTPTATGHAAGGPLKGYISSSRSKTSIYASWNECPAWEYIAIRNISNQPQSVTISPSVSGSTTAPSYCSEPTKSSSGLQGDLFDTFTNLDAHPSIPAELTTPVRLTELQVFPVHVDVHPAAAPALDAAPHTGNWTAQPVNTDPLGNPRPHAGIRFTTDGPGLTEFDPYDLSITMIGHADTLYALFAFDAQSATWYEYEIDLQSLPWFDELDNHHKGDTLHSLRGWQGWDDDPAFDAPVTTAQARSAPNAIEVAGPADILHPFEDANAGGWSFTAWQYIPADFTSAGTGNFDGSYFVLLNTYNHNGPYHWSVQLQFDSNDGLCKVFHGDGTDRIAIPFETDRWVKIQTIVDLDDDWTRIYYDDELVTEYSWTGGVLGDGGGTLDIAAVDLFAQGSSPIFYDDLVLEPANTCRPDLTNDQSLDFFDVLDFLSRFAANDPIADWNNDEAFNFFDVLAFLSDFSAACD